jgi:hypothetical protein
LSRTNVPPNVDRGIVPSSVSSAISAATTPRSDTGMASHFRLGERNTSTTRTTTTVPDTISSGRIAW